MIREHIAGIDVGNGYTKGNIDGKPISAFPSSVAHVTSVIDVKKETPEEIASDIEDIYNTMYATFDSPLIKNNMTGRFFGARGIMSGRSLEQFDVNSHLSKAEADLSAILCLGALAGRVLQDYWAENHKLPADGEVLEHSCILTLALPINEYRRFRKPYGEGFRENTHMVTIHNFAKPVRIKLSFTSVSVLAEGESAHYGILFEGERLMQAMLDDLKARGEVLEGITARDVLAAKNTVGIDIGEGTTNFPVFRNGQFSPDASSTYPKGHGHVLIRALERLQQQGYPFQTRKALSEYLNTEPSPLARAQYEAVKRVCDEEEVSFADDIRTEFTSVMNRTNGFTEVVYVYGGGATPLKFVFHQKIIDAMKSFGMACPVLYLPSSYSRRLNGHGLYCVAKQQAERVLRPQPAAPKGKK